jgi:hypothetical protein
MNCLPLNRHELVNFEQPARQRDDHTRHIHRVYSKRALHAMAALEQATGSLGPASNEVLASNRASNLRCFTRGKAMFQKMYGPQAYDARQARTGSIETWGGTPSSAAGTVYPSRSRERKVNRVLNSLCSAVSFLAIHPVGDRKLLYSQYDFKLRSHQDKLGSFCASVLPSLVGMALVLVAYKAASGLRSMIE